MLAIMPSMYCNVIVLTTMWCNFLPYLSVYLDLLVLFHTDHAAVFLTCVQHLVQLTEKYIDINNYSNL